METVKEDSIPHYIEALNRAKTDNEKFAALLMVAKVTKDWRCGNDVKKDIFKAIGKKFFSRLLKAKSVPEDCPPNIYKYVAMPILSALCGQTETALNSVLKENIASLNGIVLLNPSKDELRDCQLVDDTYECFNSLCQSSEGIEIMLHGRTVSTLCESVISQSYGCEKGQDVLFCILSGVGIHAWEGCEMLFNSIFSYFSRQFKEEQGAKKFELCKVLVSLLTTVPREIEDLDKQPWMDDVVSGLDSILRSKLGADQREAALRLASMLIQICGVESMTPPITPDCKLLLLTTHLCCVEVRMVLEADDIKQAFSHGPLLSSCYAYLECIINHLTAGPSLNLDERQVLQLHSAMMGAFGAVIHFLKRVSEDSSIQWNSIVLATIRVLAAWMAEETTALKEEVCDLIPFLIQVSKLCVPNDNKCNKDNCIRNNSDNASTHCDDKMDKKENNYKESKDKGNSDNNNDDKDLITKDLADVKVTDEDIDNDNKEETESTIRQNCDGLDSNDNSGIKKCVPLEAMNGVSDKSASNCDDEPKLGIETSEKEKIGKESKYKRDYEQVYDVNVLQNIAADTKVELTEQELEELHLRVNIFHFLLPGLCHMTADDIPRQILLNCGALSLLDLYMWRQCNKFVDMKTNREIQSSIVILCNIFLNLTIVQPEAVNQHREFTHVLMLMVKGVPKAGFEYMVLWSHLITLGLMLTRLLYHKLDEGLEPSSILAFFQSCVTYLNSAYTVKYKRKGQAVLELSEDYVPMWDQISQTWFLSMQAFCALIPLCKELASVVLQSGWLPSILKNLLEVRGNGVQEETRSCYLMLLINMAKESEAAKQIIKEKKGVEISKMYKSQELRDILQKTSPQIKELKER